MKNINKMRRILFLTNRLLGDFNAILRGKILNRIKNRVIGRVFNNLGKNLWK